MTDDKLIEAMVWAIAAVDANLDCDFDGMARAALSAAESAGYRLVPVEPEESNGVVKNKWRTMETAPKDKTVLLATAGSPIPIWCGRLRYGHPGEPQQDVFAWRCSSSGRFASPTHWMPLPAAPDHSEQVRKMVKEVGR